MPPDWGGREDGAVWLESQDRLIWGQFQFLNVLSLFCGLKDAVVGWDV